MGATTFITVANGPTAAIAFKAAVEDAQFEYGNSGYTGTIAEKDSFKEVPFPEGLTPAQAASAMTNNPPFDDKYGPAGCFKIGEGEYMFFGWAAE